MRTLSEGARIGLVAALLAIPASAAGQIAWDTPRLIAPESPGGLGIFWVRSSAIASETDAAMATLALPGMGGNVILRGGAGIDGDELVSGFAGIDIRAPVARHTAEQPLDIEWYAGIGAGAGPDEGQYIAITLPMGISVGRSWTSGAIWLAPYVAMGVALDYNIGESRPEEDFTASPAADLGMDFALDPARRFIFRVATSLGDRQALAVGLNVGGARGGS